MLQLATSFLARLAGLLALLPSQPEPLPIRVRADDRRGPTRR